MVSVIIATYRRDQSLFKALESLSKQTYKDFEVVIVDDNSDEIWNNKVFRIVSEQNRLLNINYIRNDINQGSAKTRNIGIYAAKGEFITFLDDDDLYLPEKIKKQVDLMIKENADFSLTNLALYNENETLSEIRKRDYLLTDESKDLMLCHLKYHMTGTDTMMFKTEYIKAFGGFDEIDVGDEFYLMMKAIEHGGKFVYCNSCDVKAYVHTGEEGGLSSGQKKIDGENKLYEIKKQYFHLFDKKDKRYIKMRHHAVLTFAYKRSGRLIRAFFEAVRSFLSAPIQLFKIVKNR